SAPGASRSHMKPQGVLGRPLPPEACPSGISDQIVAAADLALDKSREAATVVDVHSKNALSANLAFLGKAQRNRREQASRDKSTRDAYVIVKEPGHARCDPNLIGIEVRAKHRTALN